VLGSQQRPDPPSHPHKLLRKLAAENLAGQRSWQVADPVQAGPSRVRLHDGSLLPWLYGVATNVCRNTGRSRRRRLRALGRLPEPAAEPDHAEEVADRLGSQARMRTVLDQVQALPSHEREVLGLVAWAGLGYEEAGAPRRSAR
jgi:hypothetical protein